MSVRLTCCLLSASLLIAGCAPLPYSLKANRETLVAVELGLDSDVVFAGQGSATRSRITLVRRFIRGSEIHALAAAVGTVMGSTNLADVKLRATRTETVSARGVSGTALLLDPGQDIRRLEERMLGAFGVFSQNPATAVEFIVTPDRSAMDEDVIDAIQAFVPEQSGVNFRPHLIVSSAPTDVQAAVVKALGVSIYQLGRTGTADRLLWTWTGEPGAR